MTFVAIADADLSGEMMMSDLIRREDAIDALKKYEELESNNFTDTSPIVMMTVATIANCIEEIVNLPSAEPEPEEFEWCTDCKEYDQERHCCHRWTKVIRQTVEEMKSAEPERKTGKWEVQPSTGEDRPFIWWKCSECGHVIFSETERDRKEFHAFCGRCGAEMRGDR